MVFLKQLDGKKFTLALFGFLIAALFFIFAKNAYPVPAGDSQFFLVPAVQFAHKGELTSPLFPSKWAIDLIIDPTGARRFLFFPPLFPLLTSLLMPVAGAPGVFMAIAILNIAVVSLGALIFSKAVPGNNFTWPKIFLIILAVLALASSVAETGRPETLGRLWVVLGALAFFYAPKKYDWVFYGILVGLMFATTPVGGIFTLLILGILFGANLKFKDIVLRGSAVILIGFFAALAAIAAGPFGVKETIEGTILNAVSINRIIGMENLWFTPSNLFNYYIASPVTPFYGLVIVLVFVCGIFFYRRFRRRLASPAVSVICALILFLIVGKMIYSIGHVFYIALFAPLLFAVFIRYFLEGRGLAKIATVAVLALVATGFIRTALLFPFFLEQEASLDQARSHFAEIRESGEDGQFGVTGGFWTLTEDYKKVYLYTWPDKPKEATAFIFLQQRYSGMREPPPIEGCALSRDAFSKELPRLFGVKLGNTMPGYGYTVYDCRS